MFHAKANLTGDVNLDKPDLSSAVRVKSFIGRYFSCIYSATVAEEIQNKQNLISHLMFFFVIFYLIL